jgi:hypothetical protein
MNANKRADEVEPVDNVIYERLYAIKHSFMRLFSHWPEVDALTHSEIDDYQRYLKTKAQHLRRRGEKAIMIRSIFYVCM